MKLVGACILLGCATIACAISDLPGVDHADRMFYNLFWVAALALVVWEIFFGGNK